MLFGPESYETTWLTIAILIGLAALGEAIEFGTSVVGTKKMGGSGRGATLSVVGSVIGGIAGAILGLPIPIPLVGSLVGSLLFASLGAFIGAFIGEKWIGKSNPDSVKISTAAFLGRLFWHSGKVDNRLDDGRSRYNRQFHLTLRPAHLPGKRKRPKRMLARIN